MRDAPKTLADPEVRRARLAMLGEPQMAPLTAFVKAIRRERGCGVEVPFFDPLDGGVHARCLLLLEAPGPRAVLSGFISRNNPDESARNFFLLNREAGLPREWTVCWNIVPWYIGSGGKIRSATAVDIEAGLPYLDRLLKLLRRIEAVGLVGRAAQEVEPWFRQRHPRTGVFCCPHPSPVFVNRHPANRKRLCDALARVAGHLRAQVDLAQHVAGQDV